MKILVVDDSRIMRNVLKNILKEKNIGEDAILEAGDGVEALKILKSEKVNLVLLDWNMPKLNGVELVKIVRYEEDLKDIPIIMVTSEAARYNVMEAIKAGVTDYIIKPIKGECDIVNDLKTYLSLYVENRFMIPSKYKIVTRINKSENYKVIQNEQ